MRRVVLLVAACLAGGAAAPADTFTVQSAPIADEKAVFATIESPNVVPLSAHDVDPGGYSPELTH